MMREPVTITSCIDASGLELGAFWAWAAAAAISNGTRRFMRSPFPCWYDADPLLSANAAICTLKWGKRKVRCGAYATTKRLFAPHRRPLVDSAQRYDSDGWLAGDVPRWQRIVVADGGMRAQRRGQRGLAVRDQRSGVELHQPG